MIYSNATIARDNTINSAAETVDTLLNIASYPLLFFFPKSCSAPPPIDPDNPALFPDCNNILAIKTILVTTSKIINTNITYLP